MSFERSKAQTFCESIFGCSDFEQFYNITHTTVETFTLGRQSAYELSSTLKEDARDLYFKGCQSLTESLNNFSNKLYSWAIIKAYYSIFYMIKADFALRDYALIRHKCIYYLKAQEGCIPTTKGRKGKRSDYSGDHKSTLNYYIDLFFHSDKLLSQEIEGCNAYHWIMKKREQVNYQERNFNEPNRPVFLNYIDSRIIAGDYLKLLQEIYNDKELILTFQPEYAPIAIPLGRAILTKKNFNDHGIQEILTNEQAHHIDKFNPYAFK
ncbi:MAG: hypothetical protein RLZZ357_1137 [Bacteroidota bacterium]|jgi:uncharacterized protein (UPF0332 family)